MLVYKIMSNKCYVALDSTWTEKLCMCKCWHEEWIEGSLGVLVIQFVRKEKGEWMRDSWITNHMSILCISPTLTARDCYCYRINWPFSKWVWSPSCCLWCSGLLAQAQEVCIFLSPRSFPGIESSRVLILALASTWFLKTLNFSQK